MVIHFDTSLLSLLSCSWKSISQLAISSTRKALFGLPPFALCLAPSCCQWLEFNPIHALQFFYWHGSYFQVLAPCSRHIKLYVWQRSEWTQPPNLCRSAPLHPPEGSEPICRVLPGEYPSLDKWPHGLSHLTFRIDSGGIYAAGRCCYPLFVGTEKAREDFHFLYAASQHSHSRKCPSIQ